MPREVGIRYIQGRIEIRFPGKSWVTLEGTPAQHKYIIDKLEAIERDQRLTGEIVKRVIMESAEIS